MAANDYTFLGIKTGEQAAREIKENRAQANLDVMFPVSLDDSNLASCVMNLFEEFKRAKEEAGVTDTMLENLRQIRGEYPPAKLAAIENDIGGSTEYIGATGYKYRAAVSWLLDIFTNEDNRAWGLKPSPEPELSMYDIEQVSAVVQRRIEESMAENPEMDAAQLQRIRSSLVDLAAREVNKLAKDRAARLEDRVADVLEEGGLYSVFSDFVGDLVGLKAGILKGPVKQYRKVRRWEKNIQTGVARLKFEYKPVDTFSRVSPFDAFPDPNSVDFELDFIERVKYSKTALQKLKKDPHYDKENLTAVLSLFDSVAGTEDLFDDTEQELRDIEDRDSGGPLGTTPPSTLEGYEAWLTLSGAEAISYGFEESGVLGRPKKKLDPDEHYDVVVIVVADRVIHRRFNQDPLGRKPYSKCGWFYVPGSFWYQGLPELMKDTQNVANASGRALVNNMAISSGPQAVFSDISRLPPGEKIEQIRPFRVWQFTNRAGVNLPPLEFVQPKSNVMDNLRVMDRMLQLSDDITGVPAYSYGNDKVAGAGRTYGGLSMLMSNAAKGIKRVVLTVDRRVFRSVIERVIDGLFQGGAGDPTIQGDVEIVPVGVVALMAKEQMAERRMEFLRETNNPTDLAIMGHTGRATALREAAKTLEVSGQQIVPPDEEVERNLEQQRQASAQAQQSEQQLQTAELQLKAQKIQLDAQQKSGELALKREKLAIERRLSGYKAGESAAKAGVLEAEAYNKFNASPEKPVGPGMEGI